MGKLKKDQHNLLNLSDRLVERMKFGIEYTKKHGQEYLVNMCKKPDSNTLIEGATRTGGDGFVWLLPESMRCKKGDIHIGDYHTHIPKNNGKLSLHDTYVTYQEKYGFACIGTTKEEKEEIKCYQRIGPIDKKIKEYISDLDNNISKLEERKKIRDKILKEFFNITKIKERFQLI